MLEDAAGIRRVVLACGAVDLRKGIDGLAMIIGDKYKQNPFEKGTLFLFCGQRSDRIKGLLLLVSVISTSVQAPGGRTFFLAPNHTGSNGAYRRAIQLPDA